LGTLDSVGVSIDGQLHLATTFPPNGYSNGLLAPYWFEFSAFPQLVVGEGSYTSGYRILGNSDGQGGAAATTMDFALEFVLDHSTDILGVTAVTSSSSIASSSGSLPVSVTPVPLMNSINGHLADFTSITGASFNYAFVFVETSLYDPQLSTSVFPVSITISYDYTPSPAAVPEPSSFILLCTGLGGLRMAVRRGRR
jgi:hypothetical protein